MPLSITNTSLSLSNITADDEDILCQIYSSTRTKEMEYLAWWTNEQKKAFLHSQFKAQHTYYLKNYTGAHFWVIKFNDEPIGRLYLHTAYQESSMRIIDISLLPSWRNKGIGRGILADIMEHAASNERSVTIHVESFNPAMKLYQKLGFSLVSKTNEVYHLLEWKHKQHILQ